MLIVWRFPPLVPVTFQSTRVGPQSVPITQGIDYLNEGALYSLYNKWSTCSHRNQFNPFPIHSLSAPLTAMSQQSISSTSTQSSSLQTFGSSQSSFDLPASDDNALAFEPEVIRAKSGERLWVVADTLECITLCKSQLLVCIPFPHLIPRTNRRGSHSVSRRTVLLRIRRNTWTASIQGLALRILYASIARPESLTPAQHARRTPPA